MFIAKESLSKIVREEQMKRLENQAVAEAVAKSTCIRIGFGV